MSKAKYTLMIRNKGWLIQDALEYWGRSQDWYTANCNGGDKAQLRLRLLIQGLSIKGIG